MGGLHLASKSWPGKQLEGAVTGRTCPTTIVRISPWSAEVADSTRRINSPALFPITVEHFCPKTSSHHSSGKKTKGSPRHVPQ
ncbi:hypothetical protein PCANC_19523 [Puccinia coronata f. sp. avenae]|uniref:Uncharacterized protein n=1 Tax=Puccinia coronata f. sp. avenae TaxID=200324 RepID=A0A2N5SKN0_9BASI|nr:hypothetical protein PCANC_19523 [Puccinia coronata f. sp. avenae]